MKGKFVASARHLGRSIWKNRACYSLMLPGIIWFILLESDFVTSLYGVSRTTFTNTSKYVYHVVS